MRNIFFILASLMLVSHTAQASQASRQVHYEIRYVADTTPWLEVTVTFEGDGGGMVSLFLPMVQMRDGVNISRISDIEVLSDYSELNLVRDNQYMLHHAPDGFGTIRYRITGLFEEAPNYARPWETSQLVTNRYVHLQIGSSFALPSWGFNDYSWDEDIEVQVSWSGLPDRWTVADSFGSGTEPRRFHTSVRNLFEARVVAGRFRVASRTVSGTRLQVAILGDWDFSVRQYANRVADYAEAYHDFWNDSDQKGYLAALIAIDGPGDHVSELALSANANTNGSTIFATQDTPLMFLERTISHEYLHRWISNAFGQPEPPHQASRWFSEGFTNFYAAYIPYRAGVISEFEFLMWNAETFMKHEASPHQSVTQQEMVDGWGFDTSLRNVPYWRGHMLAANWHSAIAEASEGDLYLHDILFELREQQDALRDAGELWGWSSETIVSLMDTHGYDFVREDYQTILVEGGEVALSAATTGPCLLPRQADDQAEGLVLGALSFPTGPIKRQDMTDAQRAACRIWLDLD